MCGVTEAAVAAMAISAAATGASVHAAAQETKATNYANKFNAQVQENNAQIAEWQAEDARQRGEEAANRSRIRRSRLIGAQRAAFAGSGVNVDVGSPLIVTESTDALGEFDALGIQHDAALEAWAYENQASDYLAQSRLSRSRKRSSGLAMTTSLLSGMSRMANQGTAMYGAGMFE